jgi:hypothetical protein
VGTGSRRIRPMRRRDRCNAHCERDGAAGGAGGHRGSDCAGSYRDVPRFAGSRSAAGVGPIVALAFMAAINDAGRFPVDAGRFRSLHDGNLEESTFPGISINPVRLGFQLGITESPKAKRWSYFRTCVADRRGEEFRATEARPRGDDLLNSNDHPLCKTYPACSGRLGKVDLVP